MQLQEARAAERRRQEEYTKQIEVCILNVLPFVAYLTPYVVYLICQFSILGADFLSSLLICLTVLLIKVYLYVSLNYTVKLVVVIGLCLDYPHWRMEALQ